MPVVVTLVAIGLVSTGMTAFTLIFPSMRAVAIPVNTTPATCESHTMQVVAHPDDDLLFMNPDVLRDIEDGVCVRTVYVTTGDANRDETYWRFREDGIRAAYATMAGAEDTWTFETIEVAGHPLPVDTLDAAPGISLVYLHLPDGNRQGTGNEIHGRESLMRLWLGEISTISAVDGTATYDTEGLLATLTALIDDFAPDTVRTQDWTLEFRSGDNADHTGVARFVREASSRSVTSHTLLAYAGYPNWTMPANVGGRDLGLKAAAIVAYAQYDSKLCTQLRCLESFVTSLRARRQYVVATEVHRPPTDIGPGSSG